MRTRLKRRQYIFLGVYFGGLFLLGSLLFVDKELGYGSLFFWGIWFPIAVALASLTNRHKMMD
jgi:hypothetical protein